MTDQQFDEFLTALKETNARLSFIGDVLYVISREIQDKSERIDWDDDCEEDDDE